jgi:hypothetical protein
MPTEVKKIRIFVASPGDVQPERLQLAKVIDELNITISAIAPEKKIVLELIRWETHVHPGLGRDAQDVVNQQIGDYDIFVGIVWKRLGTPTAVARSGTEEEFQIAYSTWEKNKSFPILFYFCQSPFPPPNTKEEVEQLGKVVDFRSMLSTKGLIRDYQDHESFADVIRPHLLLVIGKLFSGSDKSLAERTAYLEQHTSEAERFASWQQLQALVTEYENTRATMNPGDARTRQMEIIFSKMRSLAISARPLVEELVKSPVAGDRLAAIAILEAIPNPNYFTWLSESLRVEKPFVGYHAAIALLTAVRTLGKMNGKDLLAAIQNAKRHLITVGIGDQTDRYKVLTEAENELKQLML